MLPLPVQSSPRLAMRALITHCFYRRVIIWAITAIIILSLMLFSGGVHTRHGRILDHLVDFGRTSKSSLDATGGVIGSISGSITGGSSGSSSGSSGGSTGTTPIWMDGTDQNGQNGQNSVSGGQDKTNQNQGTQDKTNQDAHQQFQGFGGIMNPLHWLKYKQ